MDHFITLNISGISYRPAMIFNKSIHRFLQDLPQVELISSAKLFYHIPEPISYPPYKMNGQFPAFPVLTQMLKEKIIQPVLDDIFDHIMPPVIHQEQGKRSQVPVRHRLLINTLQDLHAPTRIFRIKFISQSL